MKTQIIRINSRNPETGLIGKAARLILTGQLVAFPTETVYGLGANALDAVAVKKIYAAKGRPSDNPMIVHIADRADIYLLSANVPKKARMLAARFWPGPLTIVLKKRHLVPDAVTAGLDSVAIRMPSNRIAGALIKAAGVPIAAPSANLSGRPSPTSATHVIEDLKGKIPLILDGGNADIGLESTVIDLSTKIPTLLRPGKISLEQLRKAIGRVEVSPSVTGKKASQGTVKSPGMKYRHYSPKAKVILVCGQKSKTTQRISALLNQLKSSGKAPAAIGRARFPGHNTFFHSTPQSLARGLFREFRELDKKGIDVIIVQGVDEKGIGLALMNRLRKAASRVIKA
jgi:L-threonylcarbamoyladenylate synthase